MAEKPSRLGSAGKWAIGGGSALMIFAAQTRPEEATSSIAAWFRFFGIDRVANVLPASVDIWVTIFGILGVCLAVFFWWRSQRRSQGTSVAIRLGSGERKGAPRPKESLAKEDARRLFDSVNERVGASVSDQAWKDTLRQVGLIGPAKPAKPKRPPKFDMPFHAALRHVAFYSQWANSYDRLADSDPKCRRDGDYALAKQVREALAREEISARGRHYIQDTNWEFTPATVPIPPVFWANSFFQPFGEIAMRDDGRCIAAQNRRTQWDPTDRYSEIVVPSRQVLQRWPLANKRLVGPPRPTQLAKDYQDHMAAFLKRPDWPELSNQAPAQSLADLWRKVDPLQLYQAACLWVEQSPPNDEEAPLPHQAIPMLYRLKKAIENKQLALLNDPEGLRYQMLVGLPKAMSVFRDAPRLKIPNDERVSRRALRTFAESISERPSFLFGDEA